MSLVQTIATGACTAMFVASVASSVSHPETRDPLVTTPLSVSVPIPTPTSTYNRSSSCSSTPLSQSVSYSTSSLLSASPAVFNYPASFSSSLGGMQLSDPLKKPDMKSRESSAWWKTRHENNV
ncbi:hypothetical protein CEUSTIGMA_g1509.t1 [Chlamydomonas eustigma]|uniref:Uncharacterized protein n=1 Tax=Chlamydomonas eustigma TaxID=1157962 RepID=A0A250WTJ5_9CHLO|nr:hypothetical protein CEUSTIGMA_g1509.t1 [Chlamydomonas eustigma]|eukprot:GAX74059.1 hypothetical protein CEUSTIGMA_g1509.t1 [Chlamydomonas eustigma]